MRYTYNQFLDLLHAIKHTEYKLNEWETLFISSLKSDKSNLSYRQSECFSKLYEKVTGGGMNKRQYFR